MQATSFDTPASVTCSNAAPVSLSAAVGNEEYSNKATEGATPVDESREAQCAHCGKRGGHLANCPFK
jgi:hypothetical protein